MRFLVVGLGSLGSVLASPASVASQKETQVYALTKFPSTLSYRGPHVEWDFKIADLDNKQLSTDTRVSGDGLTVTITWTDTIDGFVRDIPKTRTITVRGSRGDGGDNLRIDVSFKFDGFRGETKRITCAEGVPPVCTAKSFVAGSVYGKREVMDSDKRMVGIEREQNGVYVISGEYKGAASKVFEDEEFSAKFTMHVTPRL